eukprot:CAMPEP_0184330610 /NCGR_PEP_ID=MMETSP1049-20130417/144773_1 /TAXON_ID=77928 /ORGANISM="Proteomonas sulcata, Strain CCMP704" /LENGTH=693 /DNA_ID=CAMNT_0026653057 /DNA_START=657 /DNA_END=2738 /DNA_ORIENTATION=-
MELKLKVRYLGWVCLLLLLECGSGAGSEAETDRRIIGGYQTSGEFPWIAYVGPIGGKQRRCAGILISSEYVLTAAHCALTDAKDGFLPATPVGTTRVIVGCDDLRSTTCRHIDVKRIIVHPCYVAGQNEDHDDLALLHMAEAVTDVPVATVHGIQLENLELNQGRNVSLAGWGKRSNDDTMGSFDLLRVDVGLASREACEAANPAAVSNEWLDFDRTICTGGHAGKDSCGGDSGGPAILTENGQHIVAGVLSKGSELPDGADCAVEGRYGVYISTKDYTDFMSRTVAGENYECMTCPCEDSSEGIPAAGFDSQSGQQTPTQSDSQASATTSAAQDLDEPSSDSLFTETFIAGVVFGAGGAFLLASFAAVIWVCTLRAKKTRRSSHNEGVHATTGILHSPLGQDALNKHTQFRPWSAENTQMLEEFTRRTSSGASQKSQGNQRTRPESAATLSSVAVSVASAANVHIAESVCNGKIAARRRHSIEVESPKHRRPSLATQAKFRRTNSAWSNDLPPRRHSAESQRGNAAIEKPLKSSLDQSGCLVLQAIDEPFSPIFNAASAGPGEAIQYSLKPKPRQKEGRIYRGSNSLLKESMERLRGAAYLPSEVSLPGERMTPLASDDFGRRASSPEPSSRFSGHNAASEQSSDSWDIGRASSNPESYTISRTSSDPNSKDAFRRSERSSVRRTAELAWSK